MNEIEAEKKKNAYLANWLSNASIALGFSAVATVGISNVFTPIADKGWLATIVVILGLVSLIFYGAGLSFAKKS